MKGKRSRHSNTTRDVAIASDPAEARRVQEEIEHLLRIAEVHVLERDMSGLVVTVPALRWGPEAFARERGWERLRELLRDGDEGGEVS